MISSWCQLGWDALVAATIQIVVHSPLHAPRQNDNKIVTGI